MNQVIPSYFKNSTPEQQKRTVQNGVRILKQNDSLWLAFLSLFSTNKPGIEFK
jgi:hypothetical protein